LTFASDAGRVAARAQALVAAVQSAIIGMSRSLAFELARDQIRLNCISPSFVRDTPVYERLLASPTRGRAVQNAASRAPLGLPTPADIAPLAAFLVSPLAARITGQIVSISGGLTVP
jgi:NAD(P)-dependent dehydrogenase (short-subunit alcohol dehydrogenase family)